MRSNFASAADAISVLGACILLAATPALAQTVVVSAQCNIYGAGHSAPAANCGSPIGPGILPVQVGLPPGAVFVEFANVTGTVQYCPTCTPANGPDGTSTTPVTFNELAGISAITSASRGRFFEGVFLTSTEPAAPAPPGLSFSDYGFTTLAPQIAQHFYIGDGRTGTGSGDVQQFVVPPGATRLLLGFSDGFVPCVGAYSDNTGSIAATIVVTGGDLSCNLADVTEVGGTAEEPGSPDNQLTVDDIIVFINLFSDSTGCPGVPTTPCSRADVTAVGGPPQDPDGQLTVDDIIAFFNAFSDGC